MILHALSLASSVKMMRGNSCDCSLILLKPVFVVMSTKLFIAKKK